MTLADTLWDQAVALAQVRLEEMGRNDAAARLKGVQRGTSGYEAEHVPQQREQRPGPTSGHEAEQHKGERDEPPRTCRKGILEGTAGNPQ